MTASEINVTTYASVGVGLEFNAPPDSLGHFRGSLHSQSLDTDKQNSTGKYAN